MITCCTEAHFSKTEKTRPCAHALARFRGLIGSIANGSWVDVWDVPDPQVQGSGHRQLWFGDIQGSGYPTLERWDCSRMGHGAFVPGMEKEKAKTNADPSLCFGRTGCDGWGSAASLVAILEFLRKWPRPDLGSDCVLQYGDGVRRQFEVRSVGLQRDHLGYHARGMSHVVVGIG